MTIDARRGTFIYFGQRDSTFPAGVPISTSTVVPYALAVGDLNLDGRVDIVAAMSRPR